jgi:hypothetical protein
MLFKGCIRASVWPPIRPHFTRDFSRTRSAHHSYKFHAARAALSERGDFNRFIVISRFGGKLCVEKCCSPLTTPFPLSSHASNIKPYWRMDYRNLHKNWHYHLTADLIKLKLIFVSKFKSSIKLKVKTDCVKRINENGTK